MINLYEILQKVLNESVGSNEVCDAINGHNYVDIMYSDEDNNAPGRRLIQPYAYGITCAGNEGLRAFQVSGDSLRGEPRWKIFRLDRITSWRPRKQTFEIPPKEQGYDAPEYNRNGDRTLCKVILQAKFDEPLTSVDLIRKQRQNAQAAPKISTNNTKGPIPNVTQQWKKNVFTSQPNSKKYAQYAKNIKDTQSDFNRFDDDVWAKAEAEKNQQDNAMMQNTVMQPQQAQQGPITPDKNNDKDKKLKK